MSRLADASLDQEWTVAVGEMDRAMRTEVGDEPAQVRIVTKLDAIKASVAERDGLEQIVDDDGAIRPRRRSSSCARSMAPAQRFRSSPSNSRKPADLLPPRGPMTAPYRLVIFDFDGTLADSFGWLRGILNDVAGRYGFRAVDDDEVALLRGRDTRAIIRHLGVPMWKIPLIARHLRHQAAQVADEIRLFEGTDAMLRQLADGGVTLAVVSSNSEPTVRRILGPGTGALISRFGCGASLFGKAAKFRKVLRESAVAPPQVICIGDEVRDIEAAKSVGLASGAVTWGYATAEVLRAHAPTMVFERMEEVAGRLAPAAVGASVA